jgi:hypothetical protein
MTAVTIVSRIVKEQQTVMGPIALELAKNVKGLKISSLKNIEITGTNEKEVIKELVKEYEKLFGHVSIQVCKDAVRAIKPAVQDEEIPEILR